MTGYEQGGHAGHISVSSGSSPVEHTQVASESAGTPCLAQERLQWPHSSREEKQMAPAESSCNSEMQTNTVTHQGYSAMS